MSGVTVFSFRGVDRVRVQVIGREPWFCLKDVCDVLSIQNVSQLAGQLDEKGVCKTYTLTDGGRQQLTFINEPNLYRVIFRSNKPEARQFQDWVFSDVLPAIRKTGSYVLPRPTPARNREPLSWDQKAALTRVIAHIADRHHFRRLWIANTWYALRRAACNPSPNPITVDDLPAMLRELEYVLQASEQVIAVSRKFEQDVIRRTLRKGVPVDDVLAQLPERAELDVCPKVPEKIATILEEIRALALPCK
ncbi:Bro-N domain-containing protein [Salmonella enterica subsp. enterica]